MSTVLVTKEQILITGHACIHLEVFKSPHGGSAHGY